jgi:hypothetical protein
MHGRTTRSALRVQYVAATPTYTTVNMCTADDLMTTSAPLALE